ncbi:MAG: 16S rRNA (cytosine(967)-C(5))-methyltransferase RsmB, partial [Pseudoxanthomonas sp.]
MSAAPGVATRVLAAKVLDAVIRRGRSLKGELVTALAQLPDPRDRALLEAICFSALRQRARYEAALQLWLQKPLGEKDGDVRALLLVGFAQIDAMGLPAHAALSATVEAARTLGRPHQAGMINALLRRAQREGFPESDPAAAWPAWLRKKMNLEWGDRAAAIFEASAHAAPLWLRVNRRKGSRDEYAARLQQAGIASSTDPDLPDALRVDLPVAVSALPGFAEGDVSVQDGSAQQVADALPIAAGARVLDACAAPGGKSAHLLERDPSMRLLALDVDQRRLNRVRETLARIGAQADFRAADASDVQSWWDGEPFDAVLLDAPCSATGIVRRQPDVLLHRRPEDLSSLLVLQARLL